MLMLAVIIGILPPVIRSTGVVALSQSGERCLVTRTKRGLCCMPIINRT